MKLRTDTIRKNKVKGGTCGILKLNGQAERINIEILTGEGIHVSLCRRIPIARWRYKVTEYVLAWMSVLRYAVPMTPQDESV